MASPHAWILAFGFIGNVISFMVYLSPLPTFVRIYKKKSTQGFQSIPYIAAIFSSMLWVYYAMVKTNSIFLITINGFGCIVETIYIAIFLTYATKQAKMSTLKLLAFLNLGGFAAIVLFCTFFVKTDVIRLQILGWICVAFAVIVFAAPLSVMRLVIRTKSVEFMPLPLSLSLTLNALAWGMYGLLTKDLYVLLPNVMGILFGVAQMTLYAIYRSKGKQEAVVVDLGKLPETQENVATAPDRVKPNASDNDVQIIEIPAATINTLPLSIKQQREITRSDMESSNDVGQDEEETARAKPCREEIINIDGGPTHMIVPMVECVAAH